jgi:hypothetical protein
MDQLEPLPPVLPARERKPREKLANVAQYFQPDLGERLNAIRNQLYSDANINLPKRNLGEAVSYIQAADQFRAQNRAARPQAIRKLPPKTGMDELFKLVQDLHRDIKLVKDAQSKAGAEDWIVRNGLQDSLYVDDADIDGDHVPDIIVRDRATRKPYIVKGYTTGDSNYPIRNLYYSRYPLAKDRKDTSMQEFIHDSMYEDKGVNRTTKDGVEEALKVIKQAGYKVPKTTKLSVAQAFKNTLMKPIMQAIKAYAKDTNVMLKLTGPFVTKLESYLRFNMITLPVLRALYGDEIMQQDQETINRLSAAKEVKDACRNLADDLFSHLSYQVTEDLSRAILTEMIRSNMIDLEPNAIDSFVPEMMEAYLAGSPLYAA